MEYNFFEHFFSHKGVIKELEESGVNVPGKIFTPLHFVVAGIILALLIFSIWYFTKKNNERLLKRAYLVIWITLVAFEIVKMLWETFTNPAGAYFEISGILPLYPCSVIMYVLPITIWSKNEKLKAMANGYICTIGLIGAVINFFYPGTALPNYSAFSFVGLHVFIYHGAMIFCAVTLLTTKLHSYCFAKKWTDLLLPSVPILVMSIPANIVNYTVPDSVRNGVTYIADYMFFKCDTMFMADIFVNTPDWVTTVLFYIGYIVIPALFYLPGFIINNKKAQKAQN